MNLKPIKNNILFEFEDEVAVRTDNNVRRTQFKEVTDWGFEISSYNESTKNSRWAIVKEVGPDVFDDIKVGSRILIEPLKWTEGIEFNGKKYWRTTDEFVLAVDDDYQP